MSILFELERMERLTVDLDQLRRPVRIPVSCYKRMEGKENGPPAAGRGPCGIPDHHGKGRTVGCHQSPNAFLSERKNCPGSGCKPQGNFNESQGQCRGAVRNCHPGLQRQRARGPDNPHGACSGG